MIRLWNSNETTFKGNRWVLSEATKCDATEVTNGEFALDFEYPLKDAKGLSKYLLRGNIITCPVMDDRPEQQFRIRKPVKTSTGVTVYAQAKLIADLGSNWIRAMTLTGLTRKQAIQAVLNAALEPHNFKVGNLDINTTNNVVVNIQEGTVLNALIGSENSILSEYGGEFIINNNTFDIVDSRGANRKFRIAYAKNISSIKETIDDTDLATVLVPKSGDYRLPEYFIESPNVNKYEKRYFQEVDMNLNIWDGEDEQGEDEITIEEAYALMRTTCNNMFLKDKVDQVDFNYEINLVSLRKTEEYKKYNIIEKVYLGDTVTVDHKLLNIDLEGKVNKTVFNVLLGRYNTTEIGSAKQDITNIINIAIKSITFAKQEISLKVESVKKTLSSEIKLTEDSISDTVTNLEKNLTSQITQTAQTIRSEVSSTNSTINSQISQTNTKINAVVESGSASGSYALSKSAFKVAFNGASDGYTQIDGNGITIDDGRFKIKKSGSTVFYVSSSGKCTADGGFLVDDGDTSCKIDEDGVTITSDDGYKAQIQVMSGSRDGVYIVDDLYVEDVIRVYGNGNFEQDLDVTDDLTVGSDLDVGDDLTVGDDLDVDGSKNCLQQTQNYGKRRINAYETAEYYFGDIGNGTIKNRECIIFIDDIFSECINTSINYQVEIFEYENRGSITDVERYQNYFIVKGNIDDIEFGWEIKAKRIGYENIRLEQRPDKYDSNTTEITNTLLENSIINITKYLLENLVVDITDILLENSIDDIEAVLLENNNEKSLEDILLEEVA